MVAGLGDSAKVLDKDVVKRPEREFSATFMEWAADNIEQVIKQRAVDAASSGTIYSVPENHTFFLTNCTMSISCSSGAPGARASTVWIDAPDKAINRLDINVSSSIANAISFPMPIKVHGKIVLSSPNNARTTAVITGFLLPKKISIR